MIFKIKILQATVQDLFFLWSVKDSNRYANYILNIDFSISGV